MNKENMYYYKAKYVLTKRSFMVTLTMICPLKWYAELQRMILWYLAVLFICIPVVTLHWLRRDVMRIDADISDITPLSKICKDVNTLLCLSNDLKQTSAMSLSASFDN